MNAGSHDLLVASASAITASGVDAFALWRTANRAVSTPDAGDVDRQLLAMMWFDGARVGLRLCSPSTAPTSVLGKRELSPLAVEFSFRRGAEDGDSWLRESPRDRQLVVDTALDTAHAALDAEDDSSVVAFYAAAWVAGYRAGERIAELCRRPVGT